MRMKTDYTVNELVSTTTMQVSTLATTNHYALTNIYTFNLRNKSHLQSLLWFIGEEEGAYFQVTKVHVQKPI